jgi:hypothetical protein
MVLLSSLQRDLAKPTRKKEPITLDVLQQVVDSVGQTPTLPTLSEIRLLTITCMLLAFAAFLRFDEIAKLRCCDVQFHDAHMSIKIRVIASKTDQYREGNEVVVSRARSKLCPVSMVEWYFGFSWFFMVEQYFFLYFLFPWLNGMTNFAIEPTSVGLLRLAPISNVFHFVAVELYK